MQNVNLIGRMPVTFAVVVLAINLMSKPASFFFVSGLMFVQFLSHALHSIYRQPIPYWVSDQIKSDRCLVSFGNPSKILANYTFIVFTLYLHKYYDVGVTQKRMSVFCTAYIVKMALTAVALILLSLLMVSGVYLGANAWNQVLFGATLGTTLAWIGHRLVKPWIYGLWERSLQQDNKYYI